MTILEGLARLYAAVRRRLDPDTDRHRQLVRYLADAVRDLANRTAADGERQREAVEGIAAGLAEHRKSVSGVSRDVTWLRDAIGRQRKVNARLLRRAELDERTARYQEALQRRLMRMARSRRPIVVGPWTGEVGFELLYWVPFLRWACGSFGIDPGRLIVISRGGPAAWYGELASRYVDAFDFVTPDEFRAATERVKKQRNTGAFERGLVRGAMKRHAVRGAHLLHPSLMYHLFWSYWAYAATVRHVESYTRYVRIEPPPIPGLRASLPDEYVAVRFYFSRCFPDTPDNRRLVARTVEALASQTDVVLLNTPFTVDDHRDVTFDGSRVHTIAGGMQLSNNLALQTAVIAGAKAFVGTYGGYAYLAPLCGTNAVAFYSRANFKRQHLDLAHRVFGRLGSASLVDVDVSAAETLALSLSGAAAAGARL